MYNLVVYIYNAYGPGEAMKIWRENMISIPFAGTTNKISVCSVSGKLANAYVYVNAENGGIKTNCKIATDSESSCVFL